MENNKELPISTLKVDFGCTKGCSEDVTDMLKQLKGVKSISIDSSEGKVTVIGDVNPMKLIKLLQKMGKKVQLWSFDKEPKNKKACSHVKHKHHSRDCHESSDIEDDTQTDHGHKHRTHHHQKNKKMHDRHGNMFGFGNQHGPPPPYNYQPFPGYHNNYHPTMHRHQPQQGGYAMPPTMHRHQPQHGGYAMPPTMHRHQPQHGGYAMPPTMHRHQPQHGGNARGYAMPPSMYPGSYGPGQPRATYGPYGSMFPSYNPMMHYTSYEDNYRYTI